MKILFLLNNLGIGGAERQTISLLNNLPQGAADITLGYLKDNSALGETVDPTRVRRIVCFDKSRRVDFKMLHRLAAFLRLERFDTVVCVEEHPLFYVLLAKFAAPARIIVILHRGTPPDRYERMKRVFYRQLIRLCDTVVFVCRHQMELWLGSPAPPSEKYVAIHNGIDTAVFDSSSVASGQVMTRKSCGIGEGDFVVGVCAAMRKEKNHLELILALRAMRQHGVPAVLVAIGDGPEREAVLSAAAAHGVGHMIHVTGFLKHVAPAIAMCDCMALTSSSGEAFSLSILESMAMGKLVVASEVGGVREQITHGVDGYIYAPGNVAELVKKLEGVWRSKSSRAMGERARNKVRECFSVERMVRRYSLLLGIAD
ncbi:MAG TPA: glycosyltransferase family 4 protein [Humidesulfovibrio sp.]|uniref:glycosyltransferase family 4 protein n=1 Tax=Humidesulfovibrio sp. TaxID=2910988 RepID=UPI002BE9BDAE|nr:glycosyltransferase family 4 protein [Humidesulfovibrio sp.]HWR04592.1 glycosyltransferase family 4 protein [Humidesulfovibrio sp.]